MLKVRNSVFETNSSSVHTICLCTKEQYDKWAEDWSGLQEDSLLLDAKSDSMKFVTAKEAIIDCNRRNKEFSDKYKECEYREIRIEDFADKESEAFDDAVDQMFEYSYRTYNDYHDEDLSCETWSESLITPGGEEIFAFGQSGWDG